MKTREKTKQGQTKKKQKCKKEKKSVIHKTDNIYCMLFNINNKINEFFHQQKNKGLYI